MAVEAATGVGCSCWSCTGMRTWHKWRTGYKFGVLPFVKKNFIAYVEAQLKCDVGDRRQRVVTVRQGCLYYMPNFE